MAIPFLFIKVTGSITTEKKSSVLAIQLIARLKLQGDYLHLMDFAWRESSGSLHACAVINKSPSRKRTYRRRKQRYS
jgi:hypothetical protein